MMRWGTCLGDVVASCSSCSSRTTVVGKKNKEDGSVDGAVILTDMIVIERKSKFQVQFDQLSSRRLCMNIDRDEAYS
jgi:hypothetical protein